MDITTNIKPANMALPTDGTLALPFRFDFTNAATIGKDFQKEETAGIINTIQSVFIDNSGNAANFVLTCLGAFPPYRIVAQPFSQGFYPVTAPTGPLAVTANTTQGQKVDCIFYNCPLPYYTWGPTPGVLVVPNLTNSVVNFAPLAIGDNIPIAAVLGQTIKVYRLILNIDAPATIQFFSNPGVGSPLMGPIFLAGFGSITLQASGVPWMTTAAGQSFNIRSNAAVNMGGQIGFVQS